MTFTAKALEVLPPGKTVWEPVGNRCSLGLRVTPKGARTFLFRYRLPGEKQRMPKIAAYGTRPGEMSLKQARARASEWAVKVGQGKHPVGARDVKTLADLAQFYLEEYARDRSLRPSTVAAARIVLARLLKKEGSKPIIGFTPADIRRAHSDAKLRIAPPALTDARSKSGRKRISNKRRALIEARRAERLKHPSFSQANRLLTVLSKMFNLAVQQGWREDNPCRHVAKFKITRRHRYLSQDEIGALLAACEAYPDQLAANAVRLLLYTGARLNEVLKAEWSQFDLGAGLWEKPSAHTKTKITHRVYLAGPVLDLLENMREADPGGRYLFPGARIHPVTGKIFPEHPRSDLKRPWTQISRAAGLRDARPHDLRRTAASLMASDGVDRQTIGRVLGHTQASTTDSYVGVFHEVQAEALRRAGDRIVALADRASRHDSSLFEASIK
jgi:integrase